VELAPGEKLYRNGAWHKGNRGTKKRKRKKITPPWASGSNRIQATATKGEDQTVDFAIRKSNREGNGQKGEDAKRLGKGRG